MSKPDVSKSTYVAMKMLFRKWPLGDEICQHGKKAETTLLIWLNSISKLFFVSKLFCCCLKKSQTCLGKRKRRWHRFWKMLIYVSNAWNMGNLFSTVNIQISSEFLSENSTFKSLNFVLQMRFYLWFPHPVKSPLNVTRFDILLFGQQQWSMKNIIDDSLQ